MKTWIVVAAVVIAGFGMPAGNGNAAVINLFEWALGAALLERRSKSGTRIKYC